MSTSNQLAPFGLPQEDARFAPLKAMAEENWRENNPKLVKELEKSGSLEKILESKVSQAIIILQQCEVKGIPDNQARELAYEDLLSPSVQSS